MSILFPLKKLSVCKTFEIKKNMEFNNSDLG